MCARQVASHLHSCSVGLVDLSLKTNTIIVSDYDQEIPQSQTADNPVAP